MVFFEASWVAIIPSGMISPDGIGGNHGTSLGTLSKFPIYALHCFIKISNYNAYDFCVFFVFSCFDMGVFYAFECLLLLCFYAFECFVLLCFYAFECFVLLCVLFFYVNPEIIKYVFGLFLHSCFNV